MATKSGKMMTYLLGLIPINSDNSLIKFSFVTMWQTETILSLLPQCIWPPILQDGGITWGVHSHKVAWLLNYVILLYHVINHDQQIWQGGVTHNGELRPLQSHDPSVTCSCEVTWHFTYVMSSIALDQYVVQWWLTVRGFQVTWPFKQINLRRYVTNYIQHTFTGRKSGDLTDTKL